MKIMFIGDIVGRPGRNYLKKHLAALRSEHRIDVIIANAENAAGGSSLTMDTAQDVFAAGVDIITSGDHIFKKKDAVKVLESLPVLRPLNYSRYAPGAGWLVRSVGSYRIGVINLLGRVFMPPVDCPFLAVKDILEEVKKDAEIILVDMHAEATSEKLAMGYFLSGKVSAVVGTHTHIPTADERIMENSTAYITDAGMTGSFDSVLGRRKEAIVEKFVTNMPVRFDLAQDDVRLQGVIIDVDADSGRARHIRRIECRNG